MKADHVILGVHVTDRLAESAELQKVLTQYGAQIRTRLGLHEPGPSPQGVVILEVVGEKKVWKEMEARLAGIQGIEVKEMVFGH